MNERYIVMTGGLYGHWGTGSTVEEAKKNCRKAGGKSKVCKVWKFTSELPFAPSSRPATDQEADAYVSRDGTLNWIRCDRTGPDQNN